MAVWAIVFTAEGTNIWRYALTTATVAKPAENRLPDATHKTETARSNPARPLWWWLGLVLLLGVVVVTFYPGIVDAFSHPVEDVHSPGMADFFPETIIWGGTAFELNRLTLARIIAAAVVALIFAVTAAGVKLRPSRGQMLIELGVSFVRQNIGIELLGTRRGKRYGTLLAFTFFGVLGMNLTGIVPGINIAASSVMSVPLVFAIISYVTFISAGIKARGGLRFFKEQLFPPGIPWPVYFLLTPIELISTFIVRPATLAIRLLANMIAGHMLLALTYFGTQVLLIGVGAMVPVSALTLAAAVVMTLFEMFVAVLQAYVFTILTAVYIKMSVEAH